MINLVLYGCIKVSILVEEVLCEVFKHLYSKAAMLNLEQVKSVMATVGREYDLVTTHLLMSLARYCVTMTQLTHTLILQHREHTEEQGWSVRWRLVWDTAPAFQQCISHCPGSLATTEESRMDLDNLFSHFCWGEGEQLNACCSTFFVLQWACWLLLGVSQWRTVIEKHQSVSLLMKMGSCGVMRKESQRAHLWQKFKASGKIYWDQGK